MRTIQTFSALAMLGALAACSPGNPTAVAAGPASTQPVGPASQMPQSPNSLPAGTTTAAPLTSPAGNVSTTTVNPNYQQGAAVPQEAVEQTQPIRRRTPRRVVRRRVTPASQTQPATPAQPQ